MNPVLGARLQLACRVQCLTRRPNATYDAYHLAVEEGLVSHRVDPVSVVGALVEQRYPQASAAVVGGSVVAGRGSSTSDLDVVVIIESEDLPWRESLVFQDWPIEVFVHTSSTMRGVFDKDVHDRLPSMLRVWSEGELVVDSGGVGSDLRARARMFFEAGYAAPTSEELRKLRYEATEILRDLEGDPAGAESTFVAPTLAFVLCHLRLLEARAWIGRGKWMLREARLLDPAWADELVAALRIHATGDAQPLLRLANDTLAQLGGLLFDGYSEGRTSGEGPEDGADS